MSADRDELLRLAHVARADGKTWWLWDEEPNEPMRYSDILAFAHACTPEAIIAVLSSEGKGPG